MDDSHDQEEDVDGTFIEDSVAISCTRVIYMSHYTFLMPTSRKRVMRIRIKADVKIKS